MGPGAASKATKGQCNAKDTETHTHTCDWLPLSAACASSRSSSSCCCSCCCWLRDIELQSKITWRQFCGVLVTITFANKSARLVKVRDRYRGKCVCVCVRVHMPARPRKGKSKSPYFAAPQLIIIKNKNRNEVS